MIKVYELEGAALDYWVAKADGSRPIIADGIVETPIAYCDDRAGFAPSTNWAQGGPIIEKNIDVLHMHGDKSGWQARAHISSMATGLPIGLVWQSGPTALIAAMRCFVSSKFGDTIE